MAKYHKLLLAVSIFLSGLRPQIAMSQIMDGNLQSLVICNSNMPIGWGYNSNGELGTGGTSISATQVQVGSFTNAIAVRAGNGFSLVLKSDSTVWSTGSNSLGQLGDGTYIQRLNPVQVVGLSGIIAIATGLSGHSLALKKDGTVWAWGYNINGCLGNGTTTNSNIPIQVAGLNNIVGIETGSVHSLALKNDGTVWAWGGNSDGALGDGTFVDKYAPVQVLGLSGIISIKAAQHNLALQNNGTVWSWGKNQSGQLGDGTVVSKNIAAQIASLSGIVSIDAGNSHSLALKNNGTVWSWGANVYGQLGDGTTISKNSPVQVSTSNVIAISGGEAHSMFLKNDGTVWTCGADTYGQLGDPSGANSSLPEKVNGLCIVTLPLTASVSKSDVTCLNGNNGSATLTVSGGIAPYSYLWSSGQTTSSTSSLSAGNYTVTITDNLSASTTVTLSISEGASLSFSTTNVSCNSGSNGSTSAVIAGGSGNFSYSWSTGSTSSGISGLAANSYTLTLTDLSCSNTYTSAITITEPTALNVAINYTMETCGNQNGTAIATPSGGVAPYTYLWSNSTMASTINNISSGTYSITVTDSQGCVTTNSVFVNGSAAVISAISAKTNVLCLGDSNGSATVSASGGTSSYSYLWSTTPPQNTQSATALPAGTYSVTVSDANGCFSISTTTILTTDPVNLSITASATIIRPGSAVTLTGTGGQNYFWAGGIGNGVPFIPSSSAIYTLTGNNGGSCSATATIMVTIYNKQQVVAAGGAHSLALCNNGNVMAWGGNSYGQIGDLSTTQRNIAVQVYGLTNVMEVAVGYYHSLAVKKDSSLWTWGSGGFGQLGIGSATNYAGANHVYSLAGVISAKGGFQHSLALKSDGTVWSFGSNTYGQLGDSTNVQKISPVKTIHLNGIVAIACGHYHSMALRNDGTVWAWGSNNNGQLGNSTIASSNVPVKVTGLSGVVAISAGEYHSLALKNDGTVWAWGLNTSGELGIGTSTVSTNYPVLVSSLNGITDITTGMSHNFALNSIGTVWGWGLNGSGQLGDGTNTNRISPIQVNNYTGAIEIEAGAAHSIGLKNNNLVYASGSDLSGQIGYSTLSSYFYTPVQTSSLCLVAIPLRISTSYTNETCHGSGDASANVSVNGGVMPYSYLWSDGQTTPTAINLSAGVYSVTVTDANNSTLSTSITIQGGASIYLSSLNISCNGYTNGSITSITTGGSGNFSYTWSNGATTTNINNLGAGSYTLVLTDNTCSNTAQASASITEPTPITSTLTSLPATCSYTNGSATVFAVGGMPPYIYEWNTGDNTSTLNNQTAGVYTLTVSDINACTMTSTVSIAQSFSPVTISISSQTDLNCQYDHTGSLTSAVVGGAAAYTYLWSSSPTQTNAIATGLSAGIYSVTVTDANNCTSTATGTIAILHPINITATSTADYVYPGTSITLTATGASSYTWTNGASNGIPLNVSTDNTYTVVGTSIYGCLDSAFVNIKMRPHQIIEASGDHGMSLCNNGTVDAWGSINGNNNINLPLQVSGINNVVEIAAGGWFSAAVKSDGTLWTWGRNSEGELAYPGPDATNPTQVPGLTGITSVVAGGFYILALKNDGSVWASGDNNYCALGSSIGSYTNSPIHVNGVSNVVAITAGEMNSGVIKSDGTVWVWGDNSYGQLGNNGSYACSPVIVPNISNASKIACAQSNYIIIKTDSTVWTWGKDSFGSLYYVQVGGLTGITKIAGGRLHYLALKSDGTVWAWGKNNAGQLGDGTTIDRPNPIQINNLLNVTDVASGGDNSFVVKSDGTIWAWGDNTNGVLGDGTSNGVFLPMQITGIQCQPTATNTYNLESLPISIYPNPTTGKIFIDVRNFNASTLEVYNVIGELIMTTQVTGHHMELDLSHQSNGIYYIKTGAMNERKVFKIAVQRQ